MMRLKTPTIPCALGEESLTINFFQLCIIKSFHLALFLSQHPMAQPKLPANVFTIPRAKPMAITTFGKIFSYMLYFCCYFMME